jgi:hypothetical protein
VGGCTPDAKRLWVVDLDRHRSGGGSVNVVSNCLACYWFKGKELSLGFGISYTIYRLGSVANFLITSPLYEATSLTSALWFGVCTYRHALVSIYLYALAH